MTKIENYMQKKIGAKMLKEATDMGKMK